MNNDLIITLQHLGMFDLVDRLIEESEKSNEINQ
jgi:hypothetical protein